MKRKASIIINIATIALCICAIAIGVYSAKNANMSTTGTVGFNANHCKVQVVGKITGAQIGEAGEKVYYIAEGTNVTPIESTGETIPTGAIIDIDGEDTTTPTKSASFGTLQFANDENWEPKPIVFTFTITNKSNFRITAGISLTNLTMDTHITREANEYMIDLKPTGTTGDSGSITVTFEVKSEQTIDEAITGSMNLEFNKFDVPTVTITNSNNLPIDWESVYNEDTEEWDDVFVDFSDGTSKNSYCAYKQNGSLVLYHVPVGTGELKIPGYLYDADSDSILKVNKLSFLEEDMINNYHSVCLGSTYTSCIIPETIEGIDNDAFTDDKTLESVIIGYGVKVISFEAFVGCLNLKKVKIPRTVSSIGSSVFLNCPSLESIEIENASTDNWGVCQSPSGTYIPVNLSVSASEIVTLFTDTYYNYYWKKLK